NCLNFGNPEHPEVMWQLSEAIDGMAEACGAFGLPVIGGNVSLYNETGGVDIDPTPVIGLLGIVDQLDRRPPGVTMHEGDRLLLLGDDLVDGSPSLAGSAVAWTIGHKGGALAPFDGPRASAVADLVRTLVVDGALGGVHDVSTGGLGVALGELTCRSGLGLQVGGVATTAQLFAEHPGRVVVAVAADAADDVLARAAAAGVATASLGVAGGERFCIDGHVDLAAADVIDAWRDRLPDTLGSGTVQA
ncbi:MAG: phosphoribosylformylglycinamidine synthase subunit PurL, partial [Acidimicrobiales bacterium]|nr:phosphoribosylformylglycinamidine synthase subunit PurL [Acidimicrobiales bacterium]